MPKRFAAKLVAVLASVVSVTVMTNVPAHADDIVGATRAFNEAGGGCMLVQGTLDNTNVVKWSGCWDANYLDQHWNIDELYPGIYQIYNENSRKCLTVRVFESALEGELDDHLGYGKHDAAGRVRDPRFPDLRAGTRTRMPVRVRVV